MTLSIAQLRSTISRDDALQFILDEATALGFDVTGWQSGAPQRTLLLIFARVFSDWSEVPKTLAELSINTLATGDALTALSDSQYDNQRVTAVKTIGTERLTSTALVPYTIEVGQLRFATNEGVEYTNITGGTLAAGGTLDLTIQAVLGGARSVVGNYTITRLLTPLAGVTATNPPLYGTPAFWYTTAGADAEFESTLKTRNRTKFARLSLELTRDAHINVALNAHPAIRRAEVNDNNPRGAGTIDVYIAAAGSASGTTELEAAQNAFAVRAMQTDTYPASDGSRVKVKIAPGVPLNITATIYYDASRTQLVMEQAVTLALQAFLTTVPIGGFPYPIPGNKVPKDEIEDAIRSVPGVKTVVMSAPAVDIDLGSYETLTIGTWNFNWNAVSA